MMFCLATVSAENISPTAAEQMAKQFISGKSISTRSGQSPVCKLVYTARSKQAASTKASSAQAPFYVFNYDDEGFVMVAGDDRMESILGYSDAGAFDAKKIPSNVLYWFDTYIKEYDALQKSASADASAESSQSVLNSIKAATASSSSSYPTSISPLLGNIAWDQDSPYNNKCPKKSNGNLTVTGCVATAMAMVMKYHNWPEKGIGSHSYTTSTNNLNVSFDFSATTFDWEHMLDTYTDKATEVQKSAVATLMLACGVSVDMDYDDAASGAYDQIIASALIDYFGYDSNLQNLYRDTYTYAEWLNLLKEELSNGRPIIYGGSSNEDGHEFVFDGYNSDNMMHVNWGWSGYYNGYFRVTALYPEGTGIGGGTGAVEGFNYDQSMIVGMQKPTTTSKYVSGFIIDSMDLSSTKVRKGSDFTVTLNGVYNYGTTFAAGGQIGVALEKDGELTVLTALSIPQEVKCLYGFSSQDVKTKVGTSVADGNYVLCPVIKPKDGEWTRIRCIAGYDGLYNAVVSGNYVTFSQYLSDFDVTATFELSHDLTLNAPLDFSMTLTNNDKENEVFTQLAMMFIDNPNAENPNYYISPVCQIYLEPGETQTQTYSVSMPDSISEGKYYLLPAIVQGGYYYSAGNYKIVTVGNVDITDDYSSLQFTVAPMLDKDSYEQGETMRITGTIKNTNEEKAYSKTLTWWIYNVTTSSYDAALSMAVYIEKGGTYQIDYSLTPDLAVGTYRMALASDANILSGTVMSFAITESTATGIEDVAKDNDRIVVYPQPVEDVLYMGVPTYAQAVDIYDISGRLMLTQSLSGGTLYNVNVASLSTGTYILHVKTAGKVYKEKFVKR
jgi:hypothetical protein